MDKDEKGGQDWPDIGRLGQRVKQEANKSLLSRRTSSGSWKNKVFQKWEW